MWPLSLLAGVSEKIILYIIMGIVVLALFGGAYLVISHNAKHEQALIDQNKVLQNVVDNQKQFIQDQKNIMQLNNDATNELNSSLADIQKKTLEITDFLSTPGAAASDRPSSDLLKSTIEKLKGNQ